MTRWSSKWSTLSGPEKFRLYTRLLLLEGLVLIVLIRAFLAGQLWAAASIAVAGLAAIAAVEARPDLAAWPSAAFRR